MNYRGAIRKTETQAGLSQSERLQNVRGAFQMAHPNELKGKDILLVDDVYTTGATVNEVTRVLKRALVGRIYIYTLARA